MNKESLKKYVENGKIVFDPSKEKGVGKRDIFNLAHAFGLWLKEKVVRDETMISVSVGVDDSSISEEIKDVFLKSFTNDGFLIYDAQRTYIPALYKMTIHQNVTGCVFISLLDKGSDFVKIEFMTRLGVITNGDLLEIVDLLTYSNKKIDLIVPDFRLDSNLKHYAEATRQMFCQNINSTDFSRPLRGMKFVVDANGGIGSYAVDKILLPLGAEVVEVSGKDLVAKQCRNFSANVGIIFDYNLQSINIISREYGSITKEAFTYILSQLIDAGDNESVTVLTDYHVTSKTVQLASEKYNCKFEKVDKDEEGILSLQKHLNENGVNCPLAIFEGSKCCFKDNYFMPDPVYTLYKIILKIFSLREDRKKFDDLLKPFYIKSGVWRIKINSFDKVGYAKTVMTAIEGFCQKDSRWGMRTREGSVLCRNESYSFEIINETNEYFCVVIKCEDEKRVYRILFEIYSFMKKFLSLDVKEIEGVF